MMDWHPVGLSLGGNVGPVEQTLGAAQAAIEQLEKVRGVTHSPLYRTTPISTIRQPDYLNAATLLETQLDPWALLHALQQIEHRLGKRPKPKEAPRPIDIDIIFYGDLAVEYPLLQLPHPRWQDRLFVVAPLATLMAEVPGPHGMVNLERLSQTLVAQAAGVSQCPPAQA